MIDDDSVQVINLALVIPNMNSRLFIFDSRLKNELKRLFCLFFLSPFLNPIIKKIEHCDSILKSGILDSKCIKFKYRKNLIFLSF